MSTPLHGRRILIVEDDMMIALLLEDMLAEIGCEVVGPANSVASALALAQAETFDAAILDINLGSESAFPVADVLREKAVPIIFSSGYGSGGLRDEDKACPVLGKPFRAAELNAILTAALAVR